MSVSINNFENNEYNNILPIDSDGVNALKDSILNQGEDFYKSNFNNLESNSPNEDSFKSKKVVADFHVEYPNTISEIFIEHFHPKVISYCNIEEDQTEVVYTEFNGPKFDNSCHIIEHNLHEDLIEAIEIHNESEKINKGSENSSKSIVEQRINEEDDLKEENYEQEVLKEGGEEYQEVQDFISPSPFNLNSPSFALNNSSSFNLNSPSFGLNSPTAFDLNSPSSFEIDRSSTPGTPFSNEYDSSFSVPEEMRIFSPTNQVVGIPEELVNLVKKCHKSKLNRNAELKKLELSETTQSLHNDVNEAYKKIVSQFECLEIDISELEDYIECLEEYQESFEIVSHPLAKSYFEGYFNELIEKEIDLFSNLVDELKSRFT